MLWKRGLRIHTTNYSIWTFIILKEFLRTICRRYTSKSFFRTLFMPKAEERSTTASNYQHCLKEFLRTICQYTSKSFFNFIIYNFCLVFKLLSLYWCLNYKLAIHISWKNFCLGFKLFSLYNFQMCLRRSCMLGGWVEHLSTHISAKAANQYMYDFIMLWPNIWERASHLCCCAKEYIARSINAHVLYCRERQRI